MLDVIQSTTVNVVNQFIFFQAAKDIHNFFPKC